MDSSGKNEYNKYDADHSSGFTNISIQPNHSRVRKKPTATFKLSGSHHATAIKRKAVTKARGTLGAQQLFYEGYGLKVPLYKINGHRRQHPRASVSLRNKSEDEILAIVETYAGLVKKRQFKDAKRSKVWIANWIEMAETLALGPSPSSKLKREDWSTSEFDNPAAAQNVVCKRKGAPDRAPQHQKSDSSAKAKSVDEHTKRASLISQVIKKHRKPGNTNTAVRHQKKSEQSNSAESHHDQARSKCTNIISNLSHAKRTHCDVQDRNLPIGKSNDASADVVRSVETSKADPDFVHQTGNNSLGTEHVAQTATSQGHSESRTTTTSHRVVQTLLSDAYTLADTRVTLKNNGTSGPPTYQIPKRFLKRGRHGPGGDFDDDIDRVTGKGHDLDLDDSSSFEDYLEHRAQFYSKYPKFPKLESRVGIPVHILQDWQNKQAWYRDFRVKYPGTLISQWACGCQKILDEDGSESEEE